MFLLAACCLPAAAQAADAAAGAKEKLWQAGISREVITPETSVWLAGYGSARAPTGKLHDIYMKALALDDGAGHRVVLITSDFQGVPKSMSDRVFPQLEEKFGLKRDQVMFTFSHNHCGPRLGDDLVDYYPVDEAQVELVEEYTTRMVARTVKLVGAAIENLAPATVHTGRGHATFAVNRRNNREADVPALLSALRAEFDAGTHPAFDHWARAEGDSLQRFALHQALSFRHGAFWEAWPAALRDPASPDCARAAQELATELRFHAWLQYRAETALEQAQARARGAGMRFGLYLDLAVGTHPSGAETWEDRDSFAHGASLGAPPDAFSADGQNWGLAPLNPLALRARAYAPLAETLRRQLRLAGLLRIDHILGFDRAFWVPQGAPGGYVTMPREAMLAVVRIEAARARATVVGEDLGNIPDGLRGSLKASGVLGCRVMMFERTGWHPPRFRRPGAYDAAAIASFSTHDLPNWDGWRAGRDIDARARLGSLGPEAAADQAAHRRDEVAALDAMLAEGTATPPQGDALADAMHAALARSRSRLVAVQIENALRMPDQPNLPGTVGEYPNWRQRLPVPSAALAGHAGVTHIAQIMRTNGR